MLKKTIIIIVFALILYGCKENQQILEPDKYSANSLVGLSLPPTLQHDNHFATFFLATSKSIQNYSEHVELDSVLRFRVREQQWTEFGRVIFEENDNQKKADYARINNNDFTENGGPGTYNYYIEYQPLHYNNTANVIEWSIDNQQYSNSINYNADKIVIQSPQFLTNHNKVNDLTITWTPSVSSDDLVKISLQGVMDLDTNGIFDIGYYTTFTQDNGSYTVPASVLSGFNEPKVNVEVLRGVYDEGIYGNKPYLFILGSIHKTQIYLN